VSKLAPTLRGTLLILLEDRRAGRLERPVLASLAARQILTPEQAHHVRVAMARYKRGRALGIYTELLTQQGLARKLVEDHARALGAEATVVQLGRALVERRLLTEEEESRLSFQARVVFDRDQARQLEEHLRGRGCGDEGGQETLPDLINTAKFESAALLPPVGSAVFDASAMVPTPSHEEAEEILESSGSGFDDFLRPPAFEIPVWVDTSVLADGRLMVGDYRILGRIGSGGMATVYLVHSLQDHEQATALKVLRRDASPDTLARFKREALAASLFDHPNALDIYDAGEDDGVHFLAMEFFPGETLRARLDREGPRPIAEAAEVLRGVLGALAAAHAAHVVHRDVKPENVLIERGGLAARLMDFGIAQVGAVGGFEDRVFHTQGAGLLGTPRAMAPEQAAGDPVDQRADLYAAGLLLYELLSGEFPFAADAPSGYLSAKLTEDPRPLEATRRGAAIPAAVRELVGRLLSREPSARPTSAAEVLQALASL
jgi:hypothetical protein